MAKIKKIHHVALVVPELDTALNFWRDTVGVPLDHIEEVPSQQSKIAMLSTGETVLELVQPTSADSGLAKYLDKRGAGMHHICFEVDNISEMLITLKEKGVRLIDEEPKELEGRKMAFIHPKSTGGVLMELYEVVN
ncbi:MAG: methylmalonyl-CoA epimerase [Anaerolineaceae bacterium]|nr:methylmalonyl-CoA epimerase [Anaerolineaceae bacterium]